MQKALTGILLLLMINYVHAQSWTSASPNIYFTGGNVGIGTASPQSSLHISGTNATNPAIMIESTDDWYAPISFKSNGKTWQWSKRPSFQNDAMQLWYIDPAVTGVNWSGPFLSVMPSGKVGIGFAAAQAPAYKLDILTTNTNDGVKVTTSTGGVMLHGNNMGVTSYNGLTQAGDAGLIYGNGNNVTNFGFVIAPWGNTTGGIRMDKNGSVGIGTFNTSDATYRLFVETGIRTRKVTVDQSTWPDYVFKPSYVLPPLSSVATYIRDNGHLPDMPSADSVAKNGVDLGSSQAVLLKKIEELTLYVIQQQKEIDALKKEIREGH